MNYEGQICRPPMEKSSFMLPVAVGCSYNRCTFCTLFKHLHYRVLPIEQVEAELKRVYDAGGKPKQIFLGDGNAFGLPFPHLLSVLQLIHRYFPECRSVNMDATVTNIQNKTDAQLKTLYQNGVRRLYLGIETGLDDVLSFMQKDHNLAQAYEQIERIKQFGFLFNAHIMTGIAGKGRGLENAEKTAEFFNRTQPQRVVNFSLFVHQKAPLYRNLENGSFLPASELENLQEDYHFIQHLCVPDLMYDSFHDLIEFRVRGTLPQDKEKMLTQLQQEIMRQSSLPEQYSIIG